MPASRVTRQLGQICRIYKNSSDKVIAVDDVTIVVDELRIADDKFHRAVQKVNVERTLLHLGVGNRVVSTINMMGNYTSLEENSGNYLNVVWEKASSQENNVELSIEPYISIIGDTI